MFCLQRPAFAGRSTTDELSAFLQQCKEMPALDMFSNENSMNITAAMVSPSSLQLSVGQSLA